VRHCGASIFVVPVSLSPRRCDVHVEEKILTSMFWFSSTTVFSHAQSVVLCGNCNTVLCQPTGGKARLTEGCSFRRKVE